MSWFYSVSLTEFCVRCWELEYFVGHTHTHKKTHFTAHQISFFCSALLFYVINVFLGHMSVVGPRPHPIPLNDEYAPQIEKYLYRYFITPGITGHAQINGYRGETSDPYLMEKRVEYDHWYIENWSFWLDIKIIILTILNVFKGEENAY